MAHPSKGISRGGLRAPAPDIDTPMVWVRSVRWHTYHGHPQEEGAIYQIPEDEVENIVTVLKFAEIDTPPPTAQREWKSSVEEVPQVEKPPKKRMTMGPMTTKDYPGAVKP